MRVSTGNRGGTAHSVVRLIDAAQGIAGVNGASAMDSRVRLAEREGFEPSMGYQPILP